jgi:hypothetical protein
MKTKKLFKSIKFSMQIFIPTLIFYILGEPCAKLQLEIFEFWYKHIKTVAAIIFFGGLILSIIYGVFYYLEDK